MARFVPKTVGCYDINATVDEVPCIQRLFVVDTVAPQLSFPRKLQAYLDHPRPPAALLETAEDATTLTLSYVTEPDWTREGEQPVAIAGVDVVGNRTEIEGTVTLVPDRTPPELLGVKTQYVYVGEPVTYFATVYARDNADDPEDIVLTVDNSAVDIYARGSYPVTYRATDRAGNTAEKTVYLHFIKASVTDEQLSEKADEVLSKLVTEDMTQGQKAYAIYRYVYYSYRFTERVVQQAGLEVRGLAGAHHPEGGLLHLLRGGQGAAGEARGQDHVREPLGPLLAAGGPGLGMVPFRPLNRGPSRVRVLHAHHGGGPRMYPSIWKKRPQGLPGDGGKPFVRDW